jgi:hypothetical protein
MAVLRNDATGDLRISSDPTQLLSEGWRQLEEQEAMAFAEELDLGTFGQQALAQGERVVRGATLGAVRGFGDEEEIRGRAEVSERLSPVLSGIADAAPQVALGALAATGAGAAAAGLGAAAGGLVAAGTGLAAESAAVGAVSAAQAAYQRNQYLGEDIGADAENALLFGGLNFGLGAAASVLFGGAKGASRLVGESGDSTLDDIAKAAEGEAARDLAGLESAGAVQAAVRTAEREAVEDGMDRALSSATRGEADDLLRQAISEKAPAAVDGSLGRQRLLYQNRDEIRAVAVKQMKGDLDDILSGMPDLVRDGKIRDVSAAVGDNVASQRALADGIAEGAARFAGSLRGEAKAFAAEQGRHGIEYQVPGSKGLVQSLTEHAKAIRQAKTGREMFEAVDGFKRALQEHKVSLETGAETSQVRKSLEDSVIWGKAGEKQRAYNAVIHDQLLPSMKVFEQSVLKKTSRGYGELWNTEGWENKIAKFLEGGDLGARRHVDSVMDALDELGKLRSSFGDEALGKRIQARVGSIRRTMGLTDELADASRRIEALGNLAAGVPLFGKLAREWLQGDMANAFRRLSMSTDQAIERGVDYWIATSQARAADGGLLGKLGAVPRTFGVDTSSQLYQTAKRRGVSLGMAEFMGDDPTPQAAFATKRAALLDDERFFEAMGQEYQSLQMLSPETYLVLSARAAQQRQFLIEKMPPNVAASVMNIDGHPPSNESIEEWAVYWNAVRNQQRTIENVASATAPELEALERLSPRAYEKLTSKIIQRVVTAEQSGKPLDDGLLMRMAARFPLDGAISPSFSHRAVLLAQGWLQQQAQPQAAPLPSPRTPKAPGATAPAGVAQTGATFGTVG